ncbi:DEAD/DEAH box helicase-like protein [Phyllosticta citrichinensis]|uniref:DEAD/DEAH box helicase-like protein n=1 Tax=Phyllosticta citrichinensis TaxID=1130410 RepID=A0ABR1Y530_9PEZI
MGRTFTQPPDLDTLRLYRNVSSRRVDLVGDYAGSEPFLVAGDSLLLECFSDDLLDFQDGYQMLHAAWLVERFLSNLNQRKCNFDLVFFDDHEHLCIPSHTTGPAAAKYLLARAVILRHLQANLARASSDIKLLVFPSIHSSAFSAALTSSGYMFVMMNDGAADGCLCEDHERDKAILRTAIFDILDRGYNVALTNELEWRDTKVIASILEGSKKSKRHAPKPNGVAETKNPDSLFGQEVYEVFSKYPSLAAQSLSERLYLVSAALVTMISTEDCTSSQAAALLTHCALQRQLPLATRAEATSASTHESQQFLQHFAEVCWGIMESSSWQAFVGEAQTSSTDIADLVDGRLFNNILTGHLTDIKLDEESSAIFKSMANLVSSAAGRPAELEHTRPSSDSVINKEQPLQSHYELLPFSDRVFDRHLASTKLDVDAQAIQPLATGSSRAFRELTHWHNASRPLDKRTARAAKDKQASYVRRRDQRFMAEMMAYAASLTNAVGKVLEPETILQTAKSNASNPTKGKQQPSQTGKTGGGKSKQPSKKQAILDQRAVEKKQKDVQSASKTLSSWHSVCKEIQKAQQPADRYAKALRYLNSLPSSKQEVVGTEVEFYALNCLLELWTSSVTDSSKAPNYQLAARIWESVARLNNAPDITKSMAMRLQKIADALGLSFVISEPSAEDRKLPYEFALRPGKANALRIPRPSKEFQLLHCGPYFDRKMDSAVDERVPFQPDGWQRKVLDVIDAEKSLFVVAPTSAGKTFISFYAMKKVLEGSDDSVIVYVAPTKALVNQIAAEIQARFSKSYKHAGKSVWGIHTRDYRVNNATGCQVLVTVPHILQIMLLAPAHADSWSARVKRIIFDEVHCISQTDEGIIWEQLLLLAPCPIIALSATVGNPEGFHGWLASAQKAIGNDLVMVHHPHRYSDLRKFVYLSPENFDFTGLPREPVIARVGLDESTDFKFVHPVAALLNRSRGVPMDFAMEARDCFTLWQVMESRQTESHKVPASLNPEKALPAVITQTDTIRWFQSLKQLLVEWMADQHSPFDKVVQDLGGDLYKFEAEHDTDLEPRKMIETVLPLLYNLHEQAALPAILFNFDRSMCEEICRTVMEQLKQAEQKWKETSPVWAKKMESWETWKKSRKGMSKKKASTKTSAAPEDGMGKADLERDAASADADSWETFDPNAPLDGFHFLERTKLQKSELEAYARELRYRGVPDDLIEALSRGIGVHHAGMNRKYRHVVEIFFRKGLLRVVIATGTLALGINMPCKTVAFCGDSVFLTALNFRQAAGRAGRRGFDVLGNVVFHGIPVSKVCRLLSSRLPEINGHFPITTTLVLRLCTLLSESKHSDHAVRSVDALLSQPRLYLGGDENRMSVLHHLRFSLEYLRRQSLLDQNGNPLNFAGCVSHLYYTEPSNMAFHALLKEGYFHKLCAGIRKNPEMTERVTRTLMLVLSHIFGRQFLPQVTKEFVEIIKNSPSNVILPRLPEDAENILHQHNEEVLGISSAYVRSFVSNHVTDPDCYLPLTGTGFGNPDNTTAATPHGKAPTTVRSSFVALSGHRDDTFTSVNELCRTVRAGVFLEEAVIPYLPIVADLPLNAYLLDFFKHGDVTALANANNIKKGEVWFLLNDFSMILATITASLTNFVKGTDASEDDDMLVVGDGDAHEGEVEDQLGEEAAPVETTKKPLPDREKSKKKIMQESWDDEGDDDGDAGAGDVNGETNGQVDDGMRTPVWEDDGEGNLLDVLFAFKKLAEEFNLKFKAMWA